ncbi:MAG: hypothetical protein WB404_07800 [Methanoregula sp.]
MPAAWEMVQIVTPVSAPVAGSGPVPVRPGSLAVLIPHGGEVTSEWALKLRDISLPVGTQMFMSRGMPIDVTRDSMVKAALNQGFEWIFFLDSDVVMPRDGLEKLLSHRQPMMCGMYKAKKPGGWFWAAWMRTVLPEPKLLSTPDIIADRLKNDPPVQSPVQTTPVQTKPVEASSIVTGTEISPATKEAFSPILSWTGRLITVDVIGTGCMLVHRSVFEGIRAAFPKLPWFFWAKERSTEVLDSMNLPDPLMREVSEDFFFCLLAKKSGFSVVVDTEVQCDHLALVKITPSEVTLPSV